MDDRPTGTEILLLGSVEVWKNGEQQDLRGHKQQVAIARLALGEGRPVSVSSLIDDLWEGEVQPKDPEHALQAHMSRLRSQLSVEIEFAYEGYRLTDASVRTDMSRFAELSEDGRSALEGGDPERAAALFDEAIALWRGPALGAAGETGGLRPYVLRLEEMRRHVDTDRIEAHLQGGDVDAIVGDLRESLASDPLQETAWHQLMRAYWGTGREAEALAAYSQAREAFIERLGVDPGTRLSALHQEMLVSLPDSADPVPAPGAPPAHPALSWRETSGLVGRRHEMAILAETWQSERDHLVTVTLSGEPGIGKTRLAREFAHSAAASGARVLSGRCQANARAPYRPFVQMIREYIDGDRDDDADAELRRRAGDLSSIVPELGDIVGSETSVAPTFDDDQGLGPNQHRIMNAIAAWLASVSQRRPLVLMIDDLQWADKQSLLLAQYLIDSPRGMDAVFVVCLRDRQISSGGVPATDALLRQSDRVVHLPLARFTGAETSDLIEVERDRYPREGELPEWTDDYVRSVCGGNPLFAVELTRQLLLAPEHPGAVPPPPAGITRVIAGRIAELPDRAQVLLRAASVVGGGVGPALLAEVCEQPDHAVDADLDTALHLQLIEPETADSRRYRFSHDIVRRVLYESLPARHRSRLHSRIAEILDEAGTDSPVEHHQLLAHHLRNSDLADADLSAARHMHAAGRKALARGAPADAASVFEDAMSLIESDSHPELWCDLLIGLGSAQLQLSSPQYRTSLLEAARVAHRLDDVDRLTEAVLANNRGWWSSIVDVDHERVADIETALHRTGDDRSSRSQLQIAWALENVREPSLRETVLQTSELALKTAEASGDPAALASVLSHRYAVLHALFEDATECVDINERLMSLATRHGDQLVRLSAAVGLAQSGMRLGEYAMADRYLAEATHLAEVLNQPPRLWLVRGWEAMRTAIRGNFEAAETLIGETFELGARSEQPDALIWFAGQMFTLRMLQDRLPEITDVVVEQVDESAVGIPAWRAALSLALARSGRHDEANTIIDEFLDDDFGQLPYDMIWLNGLHYLAMASEILGREDVAVRLYPQLVPFAGMVASIGTVDAGPVDLQLGVLAHLRGQDDVAGQHLRAAATLCRRIDAPVWRDQVDRRLRSLPPVAV